MNCSSAIGSSTIFPRCTEVAYLQKQHVALISHDVWFEREHIQIIIITIVIRLSINSSCSFIHFYLQMSLIFLWLTLYWVFCQTDCYLGSFNCTLTLTPLGAWRAVSSATLLSAGLLQRVTIVSASHSSGFYVSLMVNIRHCTVSVPSVHILRLWCDALTGYGVVIDFWWLCFCACGYWIIDMDCRNKPQT